jgi:hypothetical protein
MVYASRTYQNMMFTKQGEQLWINVCIFKDGGVADKKGIEIASYKELYRSYLRLN